jgi:hypothetical protein
MTDDVLAHYGILRRSGRYPWGSGETPEERSRGFLGYVKELEAKGVSQVDIAKGLGEISGDHVNTSSLRAARAIALNEVKKADVAQALRLQARGLSNVAIGKRMGVPESSVRAMLKPDILDKLAVLDTTAGLLKSKVEDGGFLDIGQGTENHLGISKTKLANAVAKLKEEGYAVENVQVPQLGAVGNKTTVKVLALPGTTYKDIVKAPEKIKPIAAYTNDGGHTFEEIVAPANVSSKRIKVVYAEQGGSKADGIIYLRPGIPELSLGAAHYAQVRIAVDGSHYLKGMAMYKPDMEPGSDFEFHTSKSDTGNKLDAMKKQSDEEIPFTSTIHQKNYVGEDGKEHLSPLNIVNEQGDWDQWSRNLSSQALSKQPVALAKRQLDLALQTKREDLHEIMQLTNPVVRKALLTQFANSADRAAVHLKAAALPGQRNKVILPFSSMKESDIYAPGYENGTRVALIRHPHGGTFEIPELTVNNKYAPARAALGNAPDAVGIHPKVAERLSGADFDGDAVLVIPNNRGEVKSSAPLQGLKDFDPKQAYAPYDGMHTVDGGVYNAKTREVEYGPKGPVGGPKQHLMGDVSNLITDMTIRGAKPEELAAAVRHSMVVIDSEKHSLNFKQSYVDNGIASLKERYQGRSSSGRLAGASTIVSRAGSEARVPTRRPRRVSEGGPIDPLTGAKAYTITAKPYQTKSGKTVTPGTKSKKLAEVTDARTLSSGMPIEEVYASHSNNMKALANQARKATLSVGKQIYSPTANKTYSAEVASLNAKLNAALRNSPKERQAQLVAGVSAKARISANPGMDQGDVKKINQQELIKARARLGARKPSVKITQEEWQAIQSGAITGNKLESILSNADQDQVRKLATPRAATVMTSSKLAIAKARLASGYTQAEVAQSLGVPVSTLESAIQR